MLMCTKSGGVKIFFALIKRFVRVRLDAYCGIIAPDSVASLLEESRASHDQRVLGDLIEWKS